MSADEHRWFGPGCTCGWITDDTSLTLTYREGHALHVARVLAGESA